MLRSTTILVVLILAAMCSVPAARADEELPWSIEAEIELGVEANISADDPDEETSDLFVTAEIEASLVLGERASFFTELTLESVTDPTDDRVFEDLGLYVGEVGLSFDLEPVTLNIGKINPAFGSAWDTAPGYFGANFAEDYELEEMIGASAVVEISDATITFSAFYPDNTHLSDSWGTHRGRNRTSDGGVGNTGELNNFALQYDHEFDATSLHLGVRHLAKGQEVQDENAAVIGVTHGFGKAVSVIAEYAYFSGWEGSEDTARIATIGASIRSGAFTISTAMSERKITAAPSDRLFTFGVDHEFDSGAILSSGYARTTEEGENVDSIALTLIVPLER